MSSLNDHTILGRLGQDPDVRYTQENTAVANLSIATSTRYKDKNGEMKEDTQWHRVVAWGRTAEICQEYLKKGDQVLVKGPVKTRQWEDKEGITRYTTETTALKLVLIGGGGGGNSVPHPAGEGGQKASPDQKVSSNVDLNEDFDDIDDDLPF